MAGIDLEVARSEVLVLVGPSGCGKSTVLRLVAGLDTPDAGAIRLSGRDLAGIAPQDRDVAMVFQGYALYPHMTVRENIAFPLKMRGVGRGERELRVAEAAKLLSIGKLVDRRIHELSGGERQRVAMGRALVRRPSIFLFDEPLSNLDAALRSELRVELASLLRKLEATAIYVTHDQVEAMTIGHRIAVMRAGSILQIGKPAAIYADPASLFVAEFLGSTRINTCEVRADGGTAWGAALEPPTKGPSIVAVRPEDVSIATDSHSSPDHDVQLDARIDLVEPLGSETVVHCTAAGVPLRARVQGFVDLEAGTEIRLLAPRTRLLWFDGATEQRVGQT